jgi:hypothetical protein
MNWFLYIRAHQPFLNIDAARRKPALTDLEIALAAAYLVNVARVLILYCQRPGSIV